MLSDALATFARETALNTGAANTYTIGSQIDTEMASPGLGALTGLGTLFWVVLVDTAVDSAGDGVTTEFLLVSDDSAALTSPTIHLRTGAIAQASLGAGVLATCQALPPTFDFQRYIGIRHTTAVEAVTAGAVTSFLTQTPPRWNAFPQSPAHPFATT